LNGSYLDKDKEGRVCGRWRHETRENTEVAAPFSNISLPCPLWHLP